MVLRDLISMILQSDAFLITTKIYARSLFYDLQEGSYWPKIPLGPTIQRDANVGVIKLTGTDVGVVNNTQVLTC
jgi:hypothetical protein